MPESRETEREAALVARNHDRWIVWKSRPVATRSASNHQWPAPRGYEETVIADTWDELDELLTTQDDLDRAHAS